MTDDELFDKIKGELKAGAREKRIDELLDEPKGDRYERAEQDMRNAIGASQFPDHPLAKQVKEKLREKYDR